jgi:hypothetical protein
LNKEEKQIPISSVVLSSQRVDMKDALFDAAKAKDKLKEASVNPLVQDGKKLVPSVNRVFSTTREIYVYFQAYKPPTPDSKTPSQPVFAFVSLYLAGNKVFETPPAAVAPIATSRLGTMPMSFSLGVNGLPQGEYDCQVSVLDPATGKATFWRAPILLVP